LDAASGAFGFTFLIAGGEDRRPTIFVIGYLRRTGADWRGGSMESDESPTIDNFIFGEIQVLLAEKRTALSSLRTGIAIFALPLSVLSVLIATSRYYNMKEVVPLLAPLLLLNLGLVVLGCWLIYRSIKRLHHYDQRIKELTKKYASLADFVE
jgi:uncharacterized membrane protein YidH (DUF202 family)